MVKHGGPLAKPNKNGKTVKRCKTFSGTKTLGCKYVWLLG
jgi:hypothetical protein